MAKLKSDIEINQDLLQIGDTIYYTDDSNCNRHKVTDLFTGGFTSKDDDGYEYDHYFEEMQIGWSISEKSKHENSINKRFIYK